MPTVKPALRFFSHNSILRKLFCRFILPLFGLIIFLSVLFKQASDRIILEDQHILEPPQEENNFASNYLNTGSKIESKDQRVPQYKPSERPYDEWCQARDYVDQSMNPVFIEFENWIEQYKELACILDKNCTTHNHDPRKVAEFYERGVQLAQSRAKILTQIIRGDPRKALELAIDQKILSSNLPADVLKYT